MARVRGSQIYSAEILGELKTAMAVESRRDHDDEVSFKLKMNALQRFLNHGMSRFSIDTCHHSLSTLFHAHHHHHHHHYDNDDDDGGGRRELRGLGDVRTLGGEVLMQREGGSLRESDAQALRYLDNFTAALHSMRDAQGCLHAFFHFLYRYYYDPDLGRDKNSNLPSSAKSLSRANTLTTTGGAANGVKAEQVKAWETSAKQFGILTLGDMGGTTEHKLKRTVGDMKDILERWDRLMALEGEIDPNDLDPESQQDLLLLSGYAPFQRVLRLLPDVFAKFYKCLELAKQWWTLAHDIYPQLPISRPSPEPTPTPSPRDSLEESETLSVAVESEAESLRLQLGEEEEDGEEAWPQGEEEGLSSQLQQVRAAIMAQEDSLQSLADEARLLEERERHFESLSEAYEKVGADLDDKARERKELARVRGEQDGQDQQGTTSSRTPRGQDNNNSGNSEVAGTLDRQLQLLQFQQSLLRQDYMIQLEVRPSIIRFSHDLKLLQFQQSLLRQDYMLQLEVRPSIIRFSHELKVRMAEARESLVQLQGRRVQLQEGHHHHQHHHHNHQQHAPADTFDSTSMSTTSAAQLQGQRVQVSEGGHHHGLHAAADTSKSTSMATPTSTSTAMSTSTPTSIQPLQVGQQGHHGLHAIDTAPSTSKPSPRNDTLNDSTYVLDSRRNSHAIPQSSEKVHKRPHAEQSPRSYDRGEAADSKSRANGHSPEKDNRRVVKDQSPRSYKTHVQPKRSHDTNTQVVDENPRGEEAAVAEAAASRGTAEAGGASSAGVVATKPAERKVELSKVRARPREDVVGNRSSVQQQQQPQLQREGSVVSEAERARRTSELSRLRTRPLAEEPTPTSGHVRLQREGSVVSEKERAHRNSELSRLRSRPARELEDTVPPLLQREGSVVSESERVRRTSELSRLRGRPPGELEDMVTGRSGQLSREGSVVSEPERVRRSSELSRLRTRTPRELEDMGRSLQLQREASVLSEPDASRHRSSSRHAQRGQKSLPLIRVHEEGPTATTVAEKGGKGTDGSAAQSKPSPRSSSSSVSTVPGSSSTQQSSSQKAAETSGGARGGGGTTEALFQRRSVKLRRGADELDVRRDSPDQPSPRPRAKSDPYSAAKPAGGGGGQRGRRRPPRLTPRLNFTELEKDNGAGGKGDDVVAGSSSVKVKPEDFSRKDNGLTGAGKGTSVNSSSVKAKPDEAAPKQRLSPRSNLTELDTTDNRMGREAGKGTNVVTKAKPEDARQPKLSPRVVKDNGVVDAGKGTNLVGSSSTKAKPEDARKPKLSPYLEKDSLVTDTGKGTNLVSTSTKVKYEDARKPKLSPYLEKDSLMTDTGKGPSIGSTSTKANKPDDARKLKDPSTAQKPGVVRKESDGSQQKSKSGDAGGRQDNENRSVKIKPSETNREKESTSPKSKPKSVVDKTSPQHKPGDAKRESHVVTSNSSTPGMARKTTDATPQKPKADDSRMEKDKPAKRPPAGDAKTESHISPKKSARTISDKTEKETLTSQTPKTNPSKPAGSSISTSLTSSRGDVIRKETRQTSKKEADTDKKQKDETASRKPANDIKENVKISPKTADVKKDNSVTSNKSHVTRRSHDIKTSPHDGVIGGKGKKNNFAKV